MKPPVVPVLDLFNIENSLTSEQKLLVENVRRFVQTEIQPLVRTAYRDGVFPEGIPKKLGNQGLLGPQIVEDLDPISYGLILRELERCDSGLRSFASVQGALVMQAINEFGSEEQKQRWLPKLAAGDAIGCFGLTEPDGGSDPGAMKTRAIKKGQVWTLTGRKMWITNGSIADLAVVWAKTDEGIRGFILEKNQFKAPEMTGKLSLRMSRTSELVIDAAKLDQSSLLPKANSLGAALACLNAARYGIAWGVLGAAEACFAEALSFAQERVSFGKSLVHFQLVQRKLAIMASKITQAQLLALELGRLKEKGQSHFVQVSLAKQNNVEIALDAARVARDILGANGILDEYQAMRHLCNLETVNTYEGTSDIHLLIMGQYLTGVSAFSG